MAKLLANTLEFPKYWQVKWSQFASCTVNSDRKVLDSCKLA